MAISKSKRKQFMAATLQSKLKDLNHKLKIRNPRIANIKQETIRSQTESNIKHKARTVEQRGAPS